MAMPVATMRPVGVFATFTPNKPDAMRFRPTQLIGSGPTKLSPPQQFGSVAAAASAAAQLSSGANPALAVVKDHGKYHLQDVLAYSVGTRCLPKPYSFEQHAGKASFSVPQATPRPDGTTSPVALVVDGSASFTPVA